MKLAAFALLLLACRGFSATVETYDRFLPLVHDGDGWSTQITLVNLSAKPATILVTFMNPAGFLDTWKVAIKSNFGKVTANMVDLPLAPGATAVIETSGTPATLTRGFVEIVEYGDQPVGGFATLTKKEGARLVQRLEIPLSPEHERRSVVAVDLTDPRFSAEMVWVSVTSTATLDLLFRNLGGETVFQDQLTFDNRAQIFVDLRRQFPQLQDFRGTLQWTVTFPNADRYEPRILAAVGLQSSPEGWAIRRGMTLPGDQASSSPY